MPKEFRNYSINDNIKQNYKDARTLQNTILYQYILNKFMIREKTKYNFWYIMNTLNSFVDISDPDISLPNSHHALQTAEEIRKDGHPEWLQIVGFIHDLGKIMYLKGCDEDGTSMREQWGMVGDTFIVGCKLPDNIVYSEFNKENPDMLDDRYNSKLGIYKENCGLDNVMCSWGHDEYLYQILKYNKINLPEEAYYIINCQLI